jgi:hypothetical protein
MVRSDDTGYLYGPPKPKCAPKCVQYASITIGEGQSVDPSLQFGLQTTRLMLHTVTGRTQPGGNISVNATAYHASGYGVGMRAPIFLTCLMLEMEVSLPPPRCVDRNQTPGPELTYAMPIASATTRTAAHCQTRLSTLQHPYAIPRKTDTKPTSGRRQRSMETVVQGIDLQSAC